MRSADSPPKAKAFLVFWGQETHPNEFQCSQMLIKHRSCRIWVLWSDGIHQSCYEPSAGIWFRCLLFHSVLVDSAHGYRPQCCFSGTTLYCACLLCIILILGLHSFKAGCKGLHWTHHMWLFSLGKLVCGESSNYSWSDWFTLLNVTGHSCLALWLLKHIKYAHEYRLI